MIKLIDVINNSPILRGKGYKAEIRDTDFGTGLYFDSIKEIDLSSFRLELNEKGFTHVYIIAKELIK